MFDFVVPSAVVLIFRRFYASREVQTVTAKTRAVGISMFSSFIFSMTSSSAQGSRHRMIGDGVPFRSGNVRAGVAGRTAGGGCWDLVVLLSLLPQLLLVMCCVTSSFILCMNHGWFKSALIDLVV